MKKALSSTLAVTFLLSTLLASPASAAPSTEDPLDPCFEASSGYLVRQGYSASYEYSYDQAIFYQTNALVRKSGQVFRAKVYSGYLNRESQTNTAYQSYSINYDLVDQTKTVVLNEGAYNYFSEYLVEEVVGWLLDDQGNKVSRTSFTTRTGTWSEDRLFDRTSTQTIARDCSSETGTPGSGGGLNSPLVITDQVFEYEVDENTQQTFQVQSFSGMGSHTASITVEPGTVSGVSKLLVVNDPNSTENQFGYSSLGFAAIDKDGKRIQISKPITVSFQENLTGKLAYSNDAKDWSALTAEGALDGALMPLGTSTFSLGSLSLEGWLFVGQKSEQKTPIIFANRFNVPVGQKVMFTTTSGSGKGNIIVESETPSICSVSGAKEVTGVTKGTCKVAAIKYGFDGYMDARSTPIRLQIVE